MGKNTKKIAYLIGIDGAGKTTLAHNIVNKLNCDNVTHFAYVYARHFPFLVAPLKLFARKTLFRKSSQSLDYDVYKMKKKSVVDKFKLFSYLYSFLWTIDYLLITYLRILPTYFKNKNIIIDRYYLDFIVNLSDSMNLSNEEMLKLAKFITKLFPKPSLFLFIDTPCEIAFQRKNDIPSIDYLQIRRSKYMALANYFQFFVFDGQKTQDELVESALVQLSNLQY